MRADDRVSAYIEYPQQSVRLSKSKGWEKQGQRNDPGKREGVGMRMHLIERGRSGRERFQNSEDLADQVLNAVVGIPGGRKGVGIDSGI